ncbi:MULTISPECIES: hypothetical protein [Ramlibacter]|uniref:Uncharacterized protein n=1 Tax=Ramlibacter pinisoli TaxID=2682844 RepID=A0A6N8ITM6_9BURK|nr:MULTISPECIES: hypothetical protein [Ramlibacter]MBA2965213.1 hypothetical protein [Ramlibacter sp. CGMCC 1.13660]MVQ30178.1 hypothetical protein [Ramlibacter pinisoli]
MRTAWFLLAGLCLLAGSAILGRLFEPALPGAARAAFLAWLALWCGAAVFNGWVGVTRAGYPLLDELPIGLLIVGLPTALGLALRTALASGCVGIRRSSGYVSV